MLQVIHRDEGMVLYAPPVGQNDKKHYEIVLQRLYSENSNSSFRLYRAIKLEEAEDKFNAFRDRLPVFITIVKEFSNTNGLQKLCDALSEHPSWSLPHLIAYFNLVDYISNPKVLDLIDYPDQIDYMSPLQLAIKTGHLEMVKALLPLCNTEHLDNNSNSVFHYAAKTTKEIINLLAARSVSNLNHRNSEGFTPLLLACSSDNPDCVKALLSAGADVNLTAGNNALYKSSQPSMSVLGLCLELFSYSVMMSYNYTNGYSFLSYMEYPILLIQEYVLIYFVFKYKNLIDIKFTAAAAFYAFALASVALKLMPIQILMFLVPFCTPIGATSKILQLFAIIRAKNSNSVSLVTWLLSAFTNFTRIYTVFVESQDFMLLSNFIISFSLSMSVFFAAWWYKKPKIE